MSDSGGCGCGCNGSGEVRIPSDSPCQYPKPSFPLLQSSGLRVDSAAVGMGLPLLSAMDPVLAYRTLDTQVLAPGVVPNPWALSQGGWGLPSAHTAFWMPPGILAQDAGGGGPQPGAPRQDTDVVTITIKPFKRGRWPDGIPPRVESTTEVLVTGLRPRVDWFELEIDNNDNDKMSGTARFVSPPPNRPRIEDNGTTTITIRGEDQTEFERDKPGRHRLRIKATLITNNRPSTRNVQPGPGSTKAQCRGNTYYQYEREMGSGFTVCAHACDFRVRGANGGDIKTVTDQKGVGHIPNGNRRYFGITVIMAYQSDSGNTDDLARYPDLARRMRNRSEEFSPSELRKLEAMFKSDGSFGILERVKLESATGPFRALNPLTQEEYADARPPSFCWDLHWYPWGAFDEKEARGKLHWTQLFWGQCRRCGGNNIALDGSGFEVIFEARVDRKVHFEHGEAIPSGSGPIVEVAKFGAQVDEASRGLGAVWSQPIKVPNPKPK
jgi:hypothetical protein